MSYQDQVVAVNQLWLSHVTQYADDSIRRLPDDLLRLSRTVIGQAAGNFSPIRPLLVTRAA